MNPHSSNGQEKNGQNQKLSQKAEKLATAVYMITDITDAREPLRWKIREEAMEILSLTNANVGDTSAHANVLYRILQAIERITHILALARNTKLISNMNASIVMKEYVDLKEKISATWAENTNEEMLKLDHQFFRVDGSVAEYPRAKSFPQPEPKRTSQQNEGSIGQQSTRDQKNPIGLVANKSSIVTDINEHVVSDVKREEKKTDRKSIILALLRTKPGVSVSDVMKELPGVSDKTVQRELVAMVEAGILEKKGEKRWSTYFLKA